MVKRIILSGICLLTVVCLQAQSFRGGRDGLLKASLTISPGFFPGKNLNAFYFNGHLEYFPEAKISIRGDNYFLVSSNDSLLKNNHSVFSGIFYHFAEGNFDPFIGLQPGISYITRMSGDSVNVKRSTISPGVSFSLGANYYVGKFINFFAQVNFIRNSFLQERMQAVPMNEIRISAGLGFDLDLKK